MGYWGKRAKDGDSPLDWWDEFNQKGGKPDTFLKKAMKECKQGNGSEWAGGWFGLFGCATLMIENNRKVSSDVLTTIYEQAKKIEGGMCEEDVKFYQAYTGNGLVLVKKPYKVFIEVSVDAFDEEFAKKEAAERLGVSFGRSISNWEKVKVRVEA